jgi:pimeloyl-ACP methyl ester carboxylesterase
MRSVVLLLATGLAFPIYASEVASAARCQSGAYELADGARFVIQPSNEQNLRYRFLDGTSGKLYPVAGGYESGEGWSVREPVTLRVRCDGERVQFHRLDAPALTGKRIALPTTPITFRSGDANLYGELVAPLRKKPRAVVVLQYGSGRDSAVADNFLQHLLPLEDIAVFVFDKAGTGRSTGQFSMHIGMLADDLAAAVNAVRARPGMQGVPLGVMGESQGGWVAPVAATKVPVDFVVVSYGLAVPMSGEDQAEMAQSLKAKGYGADVLAKGEEIHRATTRVMVSRFTEGFEELERLKSIYGNEAWFKDIGGDYSSALMATPREEMGKWQEYFNHPYDIEYDTLPAIASIKVPQLWILAGDDTEAPIDGTLARLQELKAKGVPLEVKVFADADHGMIAVRNGPDGPQLLGRTAKGYFELLGSWIGSQRRIHPWP